MLRFGSNSDYVTLGLRLQLDGRTSFPGSLGMFYPEFCLIVTISGDYGYTATSLISDRDV